MIVGQQLFDEARETADDLVDEAQARAILDLVYARSVGAARLDRELVQEYRQQPRLVHRQHFAEVFNFGL